MNKSPQKIEKTLSLQLKSSFNKTFAFKPMKTTDFSMQTENGF